MKQQSATATVPEDPCAAAIFHAVFRLISVADLYGPERAIEWAQSLLDDEALLEAFARGSAAADSPQPAAGTTQRSGRSGRFSPRRTDMNATPPISSGSPNRKVRDA